MKQAAKVSVIIPVYNCARYLPRCLESLAGQTLDALEFLTVDDGSTDGSGAILDAFARRDPRFRIIRQENDGAAAARNAGLAAAAGEYIGFVDADDYVEPVFFERLLNTAREHASSLVTCDYRHTYHDRETGGVLGLHTGHATLDGLEPEQVYLVHLAGNPVVWNKLYPASLLQNPPARFEGASLEDALFLLRLIPRLDSICTLDAPLYHYRQRRSSAMNGGAGHAASALLACACLEQEFPPGSLLPYLAFAHMVTGLLFSGHYTGQPAAFYRSQLDVMLADPFVCRFSSLLEEDGLKMLVESGSLSHRFYTLLRLLFRLTGRDLDGAAHLMWLLTRTIQFWRHGVQGTPFP